MAGHAQLIFVMTECSWTQICLTRHIWYLSILVDFIVIILFQTFSITMETQQRSTIPSKCIKMSNSKNMHFKANDEFNMIWFLKNTQEVFYFLGYAFDSGTNFVSHQNSCFVSLAGLASLWSSWVSGKMTFIILQMGHVVGGNFNVHIRACSDYFTVPNRWAGDFVVILIRIQTTRESARRGTNTPGWHHVLMYKNNLSL